MEKLQVAGQKGVAEKKSKVRCVRYAECERNHAVNNGGFVVDGCKEFVASDENGDSALKCSCCGCHMNFHRIVEDTDQESFGVGEQKEKKRRKKKSEVWDDFKESRDKDGIEWAICKHCNGQFDGSSEKGTTHLRNHLKSKKCLAKRNGGDGNEDISTQTSDLATPTLAVMEKKSPLIDLIKQMFNEDGDFIEHWDSSVFNSRKDEILQVFQEEKEKQDKFLSNLSCRFSLQISPDMFLMVHYIDDNWERQSKIISLTPSENHIEETKKLCLDLKIDRNICFIQYYDFLIDDDDEEIIESWFSQRGSLPFVGVRLDFLHIIEWVQLFIYCWKMNEIDGLRESVDYGYKTPSNNLKLQIAITHAKTMGKKVILNDDPFEYLELNDGPCFDEPFEYLEFAVGLKEAFSELEKIDPDFTSINLTNQKWNEATTTLEHFKAMEKFVNKHCKALEDFVNNFFWDVTIISDILKLIRFHNSEDCQICRNASYKKLFYKIQDYLVIIILDPRFKMDAIQHWCKEIYGSDDDGYFEKTLKHFRDVYNEYAKESSGEDYKMMDAMGRRPCTSSTKSELDLYLHHLKVPAVEGFDILAWWRGNAPFYPTLSRMALDYLAIPININIHLPRGIFYIKYCSEIDEDIKSALIYLMGLWYLQS